MHNLPSRVDYKSRRHGLTEEVGVRNLAFDMHMAGSEFGINCKNP